MKKTFTINISGSIFHIDDDAFEKLQRYLQMLNRHFGSALEGQEILQDIEARIAELLIERTGNKVEVVTDSMVDEVIARMGKAEDFMESDDEQPSATPGAGDATLASDQPIRRRLYRDGDNRVLAGVCSGMGAFFNMDPVILRVIFFLLFFIIGPFNILLYAILWISVPKAKTTAQRLEMKGKEATISNIEKSIKEEVKEVGESYNKFMNSPEYDHGTSRMNRLGDVVGSTLKVVLRVIVLLFGIFLILFAIVSIVGFIITMFTGNSFMQASCFNFAWDSNISMSNVINHIVSTGAYDILMIAILFLVGIPILVLLFIGIKLLFRFKTNNRLIGQGTFAVWLLALIALVIVGVSQAGNFSKQTVQIVNQKVECNNCKTIYLNKNDDLYESLMSNNNSFDHMKMAEVNGAVKLLGRPRFTIEKSTNGDFSLQIKKGARGSNTVNAQYNIEQITYNFAQKDSTLQLDPYYLLNDNAKWRDQEVSMILKVPEGKSIFMNEKMRSIINDIENVNNMWDGDMVNKYWTMTANGLAMKDSIITTVHK